MRTPAAVSSQHPLLEEHRAIVAARDAEILKYARAATRLESTEKHLDRLQLEIQIIEKRYGKAKKGEEHPLGSRYQHLQSERSRVEGHLAEYRDEVKHGAETLAAHARHLELFDETFGPLAQHEPVGVPVTEPAPPPLPFSSAHAFDPELVEVSPDE